MQVLQQLLDRIVPPIAACALAAATGLAAYAAHAASGSEQTRAFTAAAMLAMHGLGLLILSRIDAGPLLRWGRGLMLLGLALFVGSLLAALFLHWRPLLAPIGGSLLMLSWLLVALALWRGQAGARQRGKGP